MAQWSSARLAQIVVLENALGQSKSKEKGS